MSLTSDMSRTVSGPIPGISPILRTRTTHVVNTLRKLACPGGFTQSPSAPNTSMMTPQQSRHRFDQLRQLFPHAAIVIEHWYDRRKQAVRRLLFLAYQVLIFASSHSM